MLSLQNAKMQKSNWQSHLVSLESCASKRGILQSIHPAPKTFFAFYFSICISTCSGYHLFIFIPYFIILISLYIISHIPFKLYLSRLLIALPFSLLAGIWGCFYDSTPVTICSSLTVSGGIVTLVSVLCRTLLSVGMILILVGTTSVHSISKGMRFFYIPWELTLIFELIMRYIIVLFDEVTRMKSAWILRGGKKNGITFRYFGSMAGSLFIRSFDRASKIYQAMLCRGYPPDYEQKRIYPPFSHSLACILLCIVCTAIRIFLY